MRTADFNYHLPPELIAQHPAQRRDGSRLMVLRRSDSSIKHAFFFDVARHIRPGDLLIVNDTRVLPARLWCRKETGARIELLFTTPVSASVWRASAKPQRRLKTGTVLIPEDARERRLIVQEVDSRGAGVTVALTNAEALGGIEQLLHDAGRMPLPPYIKRGAGEEDAQRYQTVYARAPGAIAAPTAGLHFTPELLDCIRAQGADIASLTLHVGLGTFRPVTVDDPREHPMHEERFELPQATVQAIAQTRQRNGRVIAVGTTVVRVLEHCALQGELCASKGSTRLLILPGFRFRVVDALITNFHLPESTLLMMICAFASREFILSAYAEAVRQRYRFFSYGDAMLIE